jgi:hypothetical protein
MIARTSLILKYGGTTTAKIHIFTAKCKGKKLPEHQKITSKTVT